MKSLSHFGFGSLRFRLIAASILIEVILLSVMIANSVRLIDDAARASVNAAQAQAVPMLNAAAAPYLLQRDYSGLQDFLAATVSQEERELVYVSIADPQGQWVARAGLPSSADMPPLSASVAEGMQLGIYHMERPIAMAGQRLGTMRLGLSTRIVAETRSALVKQGLLIALVEVLLSILLLSAIGIWFTRHLQRAAEASRAIGNGNYALRLEEVGSEEVRELARAVNRMGHEVAQKMLALEDLNAELENSVAQRTAELTLTLQEQQTILDNAIIGIVFVRERVILRCNRGWAELLGYAPEQLQGQPTRIYYASDDSHRVHGETVYPSIVAGGAAVGEWQFQRHDGTLICCSYQGKAIDTSDLSKGSIWVLQDISAQKSAQAQLALRTQALQDSLAQLRATQTELVQAEKLASLGRLVAGVAHELNTPIGNVVTVASTLGDRMHGLSSALADATLTRSVLHQAISDCTQASDLIVRSAHRAGQLIDQFKLIAVDRSHDERCQFLLAALTRDCLDKLALDFETVGIGLALSVESEVEMDSFPGLLTHVLLNLLNNARDHAFTQNIGAVLTVTIRPMGEHQAQIVVADNGRGIAQADLPQVFDPFFTTRRSAGHVGLGLHVLYNVVTSALGGTIAVASVQGQGTTATVTLPRRTPGEASDGTGHGLS